MTMVECRALGESAETADIVRLGFEFASSHVVVIGLRLSCH